MAMDVVSIPVIDLAPLALGGESRAAALAEIDKACREWGFFQIVNHGIESSVLENISRRSRDFFAMPVERKLELVSPLTPIGFVNQSSVNGSVDRKEHLFFFGMDHPNVHLNVWPQEDELPLQGFRQDVEEVMRKCSKLCKFLTSTLFEALGLPSDVITRDLYKESGDTFILPFYPASPPGYEHDVVLSKHRDGGTLTVLCQLNDVPSLQILKDDRWITVKTIKNSFVVNVADIMQVWTNGRYKSIMHRVAKRDQDRFSMAYFQTPGFSTEIAPLPELTANEQPKYRKFSTGEYMQFRLKNRNPANKSKEITIEHYAL